MLTYKQIEPYLGLAPITDAKGIFCPYREKAQEIKSKHEEVFGESYPSYLNKNRPNERKDHKKYRKEIYQNPFVTLLDDLEDTLDYIREADDYSIQWRETNEGTEFRQYVSPAGGQSWEDYFFESVKATYINDPNAVLVVLPIIIPRAESESYKPVHELIPCENVLRFERDRFAVLESERKSILRGPDGQPVRAGRIIYFLDRDSYTIAEEVDFEQGGRGWKVWGVTEAPNAQGELTRTFTPLEHRCGSLPARKIGKKRLKQDAYGCELYGTLFQKVYPHIKDAQARYNDVQIEVIHHVHSQEWRVTMNPCPRTKDGCKDGRVPVRNAEGLIMPGTDKECEACNGTGLDIGTTNGLGILYFTVAKKMGIMDKDGVNMPAVPGGFIPRPIESLQELVKEYERLEKKTYAGMKMLFALQTPEVQSGVAKAKDREEMYRMIVKHSAHLCRLQNWMYRMAACWLMPDKADDAAPSVVEPIRFDLSNDEETRQELNDAKDKDYDTAIIRVLEKKVLENNVSKDSDDYKRFLLSSLLDPYPKMSFEQKAYSFAFIGQIAKLGSESHKKMVQNFTFSMNLDMYINEAIAQNDNFLDLPFGEQKMKLLELNEMYTKDIPTELVVPIVLDAPVDLKNHKQLN